MTSASRGLELARAHHGLAVDGIHQPHAVVGRVDVADQEGAFERRGRAVVADDFDAGVAAEINFLAELQIADALQLRPGLSAGRDG